MIPDWNIPDALLNSCTCGAYRSITELTVSYYNANGSNTHNELPKAQDLDRLAQYKQSREQWQLYQSMQKVNP